MNISESEIERYSRQLLSPGWGLKQQTCLKTARVWVDSNCPLVALYLAAAGVGEIVVDSTSLAQMLSELNPDIDVVFSKPQNGLDAYVSVKDSPSAEAKLHIELNSNENHVACRFAGSRKIFTISPHDPKILLEPLAALILLKRLSS